MDRVRNSKIGAHSCPLVVRILVFFCISLTFLTTGCGKKESPEPTGSGSGEKPVNPAREQVVSSAPEHIDPKILENRTFKEAPMLAERVKKGELPPVSERLPDNPLVVRPLEETGRYGGTIRRVILSEFTGVQAITKTLCENLMGFKRPVADRIELDLAEDFQFTKGGRVAVFKIRKGIRWSDGVPFTVDDFLFWYHDIIHDPNANQLGITPDDWLIDGKPIRVEKIDELTLKFSADKPMGMLLLRLCHDSFAVPRHAFAQYHPRHNSTANYDDFKKRISRLNRDLTPGIPRLSAWVPDQWIRGRFISCVRNPYYHKVDTEGNQLPYADRITFTVSPDRSVILLRFINGEFDLIGRNLQMDNIPVLQAEAGKGGFTIRSRFPDSGPALYLNWDASNPSLRNAFRDFRVRRALSVAINREEVSNIIFHGVLMPSGHGLAPSSSYHVVENEHLHSEFDPELSKRLLAESGYRDADGDGIREFPDGKPFNITIDVTLGMGLGDLAELMVEYWNTIGVKVHLNSAREEIIYPRRLNGEFDIYLYKLAAAVEPRNSPMHWAIMYPNTPFWHRNAEAEGPPWLREATELMKRASTSVDQEEVTTLLRRMETLHAENIPIIGIGSIALPWAASNRLGNLPFNGTFASAHRGWSHTVFHEQVFVKEE